MSNLVRLPWGDYVDPECVFAVEWWPASKMVAVMCTIPDGKFIVKSPRCKTREGGDALIEEIVAALRSMGHPYRAVQ